MNGGGGGGNIGVSWIAADAKVRNALGNFFWRLNTSASELRCFSWRVSIDASLGALTAYWLATRAITRSTPRFPILPSTPRFLRRPHRHLHPHRGLPPLTSTGFPTPWRPSFYPSSNCPSRTGNARPLPPSRRPRLPNSRAKCPGAQLNAPEPDQTRSLYINTRYRSSLPPPELSQSRPRSRWRFHSLAHKPMSSHNRGVYFQCSIGRLRSRWQQCLTG